MAVHSPKTPSELSGIVLAGGCFEVRGLGTKTMMGRSERPADVLDLQHLAGIASYEPDELILEAGAATPLAEITALLDEHEQMLAFEPPDYAHLFDADHTGSLGGSLGGVLATGYAGPRRIKAGSVRDHVLGLSAVSGRGEIYKAGARVVKNVTGYDVPKLMAGSWGTLAAFTSVIFKVLPKPETEQTILVRTPQVSDAVGVMSRAMQSAAEVSAAAYVSGTGAFLRLEGISVSVAARRESLLKLLPPTSEVLAQKDSEIAWASIRDVKALGAIDEDVIWRISVPPMDAAAVAARIADKGDARFLFDWAGGLIWVAMPEQADAGAALLRGSFKDGHARLFRAPGHLRNTVDVFQPLPPALAGLTARVKAAMDPLGKLNPGRMYKGI